MLWLLLPPLAFTQVPVWIRAGKRDLEVRASSPFTDGETEAMEGTLTPALPLFFLAFLGLWTFLPAPSMASINSPPPLLGPSGQIPGLPSPWQQPAHRAPPLRALQQAVVQGGGREGLLPLGDYRGWRWSREEVRFNWFLMCFPKEKMEKAQSATSKYCCYPETMKDQRWSPGLRTRHPPRNPLPTSHLKNYHRRV